MGDISLTYVQSIDIYSVCIDKNRAPGAAEASKAVGNAVAILTDAEKRKSYDLYGSEDQQNISRGGYHRTSYQYGYTRGFEADVTAEELFNMFFGGGAFPTQNVYTSRQRRFQRQNQEEREVSFTLKASRRYVYLYICFLYSPDTQLYLISYQFCY